MDEKIQRYTQGDACGGEYALCRPRKDPDGEIVYYEDVAALEAEVKRLRDAIKAVCSRTEFSDGEVDMDLCECMDCCSCCVDLRAALKEGGSRE